MQTHSAKIQTEDEYQHIASLTKEIKQAFNSNDIDADAQLDAALAIRNNCELLIEYDKKMSRRPQHEHELNHINKFLQKRKKSSEAEVQKLQVNDSENEFSDWVLIDNEDKSTLSHLEKMPLVVLLKIFSHLSIEDTGNASAASRAMHRMVEPGNVHAQNFWKEKLALHFPTAFAKANKRKVVDWYVELTKVYADAYKLEREKPVFFKSSKTKKEKVSMPPRLRRLYSCAKEGDLKGLIKHGIKFEDLIAHNMLGGRIGAYVRNNQKIADYLYREIIVPAYSEKPRREDVLREIKDGKTLLFWAVLFNQVEAVKIHAKAGSKDLDPKFNYAIQIGGRQEIAAILLSRGAEVDALFVKHRRLFTPLFAAAERGQLEEVIFLLNHGADFSIQCVAEDDIGGSLEDHLATPLYAAAKHGRTDVVKFLLEKGADPHAAAFPGYTPLQKAAEAGHLEIVTTLVEHGVRVNCRVSGGRGSIQPLPNYYPIYYAAANGHDEIVEYLIQHGAKIDFDLPETLLKAAIRNGRESTVNILLRCKDIKVDESDLALAIQLKHTKIAEALIPHLPEELTVKKVQKQEQLKSSTPHEEMPRLVSFINEETLMDVKKIWDRHKKEKDVCTIMQPLVAYSNKNHAQQDHDYYTGLIKDRIKSNALFCSDNIAQKQAIEAIERLTSSPFKDAKVFQRMTVSQLLFLLDHVANHRATPDREKAACAFYTALSQLPVLQDLDLNPLVRALAGHHPDVSAVASGPKRRGS